MGMMARTDLEKQLWEKAEELNVEQKHQSNIESLLNSLKEYHFPTYEHTIRVGLNAARIASEMHINPRPAFYGLLHDIGKREIPLEVLDKTEGFSEADMKVMKAHVDKGYEILSSQGYYFSAWIALTHHYFQKNFYPTILPEKPEWLSHGTHLSQDLYARVVSIADQDDALKRRNDKFGSVEMKSDKAQEIMLKNNPDQAVLINYLFKEGILT